MPYIVTRHRDTADAESWGITAVTARGTKIAAGSVVYHKHARYWDVRTDANEPCPVGSKSYNDRRNAVTEYEGQKRS